MQFPEGPARACRSLTRPARWWVLDRLDDRRGRLVPPRRLRNRVPGDFESVGREFLDYFIEFGGLRRDHQVLDIDCGVGRFAIHVALSGLERAVRRRRLMDGRGRLVPKAHQSS